jgi:hypothetical protein
MYTAIKNKNEEIKVEKLPNNATPLYTPHQSAQAASDIACSLQRLKPVLKKQGNVTQPTCSDPMYYFDSWSGSTTPSTSISRSGRSSFSSISSSKSNNIGVHFNPEIIEIEYQPEYPVSLETSTHSSPRFSLQEYPVAEEEDEEDDIEALWSLLVQASLSLKSSTYTRLGFISKCISYHHNHQQQQQQQQQQQNQHLNHHSLYSATTASSKNIQIIILLISMMKSMVSMTTTWLLWRTLSPLTWIAKRASPSSSTTTTTITTTNVAAGQSKQHKKKHISL